jgi:uncharacterized protein with HEPN domain
MTTGRTHTLYLRDILTNIEQIEVFIQGMDFAIFANDHGYASVNLEVVWRTATEDLPPLATAVKQILNG